VHSTQDPGFEPVKIEVPEVVQGQTVVKCLCGWLTDIIPRQMNTEVICRDCGRRIIPVPAKKNTQE
jgi:hypothetical protein